MCPLLSLFTGLSGFAANSLIGILNALTMIRLGGSLLADFGSKLTNNLLVDALDNNLVGSTQPTDDYVLPCLTSSFQNQGLNYYVPKMGATVLSNVISIPSNSDVYRAYYQTKDFTILSDWH